jgi:hypothetical protein
MEDKVTNQKEGPAPTGTNGPDYKPFADAYDTYVAELNKAWNDVQDQVRRVGEDYSRNTFAAPYDADAQRRMTDAYVASQRRMLDIVEANEFQRRATDAFLNYRVTIQRALVKIDPARLSPALMAQIGQGLISAAAIAQSTIPPTYDGGRG